MPTRDDDNTNNAERYRAFIENSSEGIWRFEAEPPVSTDLPEDEQIDAFYRSGFLAECNNAFARMYGFARAEELVGARIGDLVERDVPENVAYLLAFVRSGYRLSDVESVEKDKNGGEKHFANSLVGVVEEGKLVRAWGTQRDITEERRLERQLAQRERDYAALVDNAPDVLARYDRDKRIVYINRAGERHANIPAEFLVGKTFREAGFPEAIIAVWEAALDRVLQTGEPHAVPFSFPNPLDNTLRHYEAALTPEVTVGPGGERRIDGVVAISRDVTERTQTQEVLKDSEERFRALADNIAQLAWMADGSGSIFWYNRRWFDYTGTTLGEMRGWGWQTVHHPDHVEDVTQKFRDHVLVGQPWEDTFPLRGKDGQYRWFLSRAFPTRNEAGSVVLWCGTNTDITGQIEAEAKQRRFFREVLFSLTEGRLRLCDSAADLPLPLAPASETVELSAPMLRVLRERLKAAAEALRFVKERVQDIEIAVGECAMNAVTHGGGGEGWVCADPERRVIQVWVKDTGKGISEEALPRALEIGVSSAGSLGHGFWLMLRTCDRIYLLTGAEGTTVVLEQERDAPEPTWLKTEGT